MLRCSHRVTESYNREIKAKGLHPSHLFRCIFRLSCRLMNSQRLRLDLNVEPHCKAIFVKAFSCITCGINHLFPSFLLWNFHRKLSFLIAIIK